MSHSLPTPANQALLSEHAAEIRALGKRALADLIEIGRLLTECKRICGHGNWLPWLEREFGWTEMTATRFINVYDMSKSNKLLDLELPISALYLLAAPSTPETARADIIKRAQSGEVIPISEVRRTIDAAKGREQPVKRSNLPAMYRAREIQAGHDRIAKADQKWIEGSLEMAAALREARDILPDDIDFSTWLKTNHLDFCSKDDCTALINLASDLALFRTILGETSSWSYQIIWRENKGRYTSASKTTTKRARGNATAVINNGVPLPCGDADDTGAHGEVARLQARIGELEAAVRLRNVKIAGLQSEVDRLKARIRDLENVAPAADDGADISDYLGQAAS
jgi:hypothetical protein